MKAMQGVEVKGLYLVPYILLAGYFFLSPFYIFYSGMPQPADYLLLVNSVVVFLLFGVAYPESSRNFVNGSLLLLLYFFIVSIIWSIVLSSLDTMRAPLFYTYNVFSMIAVYTLLYRDLRLFSKLVSIAILCGLALNVVFLFSNFNYDTARQVGLFNNPNQMGYFGLLCSAINILFYHHKYTTGKNFVLVQSLSFATIILSFSMTAFIGYMFLIFAMLSILASRGMRSFFYFPFVTIPLIVLISFFPASKLEYIYESIDRRVSMIEHKTEDVGDVRGYSRIFDYPQYTIFGAAEGERSRFGEGNKHEIHSTLGTLLFSYGIVGLLGFLAFLFMALKRSDFVGALAIAGPLVYSLAHHGLRNTVFWILIMLVFALGKKR